MPIVAALSEQVQQVLFDAWWHGMRIGREHGSAALRPPAPASDVPHAESRLRVAEIAALNSNVAIGVIGATGAATALAVSLLRFDATSETIATAWVGYIALCAGAHLVLRALYTHRPVSAGAWPSWTRWFTAIALAEGFGWGWGSLFLANSDRLDLHLLVFLVCFGVAAGSVPTFGCFRPAFLALFFPTTMPHLAWSASMMRDAPQHAFFATVGAVFVVTMGALGLRFNANFRAMVRLQIRADDLADDLRRQKEIAEQANLAKSTFLAAASHDLRQPVHALSLFVGALRNVPLPQAGTRLLDQIEASTLALDGLFGALLDISRLDAGIVDVRPCAFALDEIVARICSDHAAEAESKGLSLLRVPCSAAVFTDPVLLERILRNLIVNAIRHTASGRVLVGCRRRGARLDVEVWDTGRGIPPEQHERIFQEYTQLDNPERDRVKGLGLGLAIVRRLCTLLDCPVGLRSAPGRGSCFSIAIPVAVGALVPQLGTPFHVPTREQGLVLVIDDEMPIQEGMARLLNGWGYAVITAGSGREMLERLSTCPDLPVLIICDHRLRDGETGPAVIDTLQSEYNAAIPAILVTGDTAPDRLAEAQASGFLLMHKPVANARLRAAISNLIAASQREPEVLAEEDGLVR